MTGERRPAGFWISAVAGWAVIAVALRGIADNALDTRPADLARFVFGGLLLHDLVVAPLVLLAGLGVARLVPAKVRPVVQAGLIASAVIALYTYPLVRGYGRAINNPTSLPHDYSANLALVLAAVWAVAAVAVVLRLRRAR